MNTRPLSVIVQPSDTSLLNPFMCAAFELFVRVGMPFSLHRDWRSVDPDTDIICYGPLDAAGGKRPNKGLAMLPRSACPLEKCKPFRSDNGVFLWGAIAEEGIDLLSGAAALLSFSHEASVSTDSLDPLGRIPVASHPLSRLQLLDQPLLEHAALQIRHWCAQKGISVENARSPWSGKIPVIMTHDVDGPFLHSWFALARSAFYTLFRGSRRERDALELGLIGFISHAPDPYFSFSDWKRFERSLGTTSTFFVYPRGAPRVKASTRDPHYRLGDGDLCRELSRAVKEGWSIGLHSGIRARDANDYKASAQRLGKALYTEVKFARAHYWSINWRDPCQTWKEMAGAGLMADTSLNPLSMGFRNGACLPVMVSAAWSNFASPRFMAIPTAVMDQYEVEAEPEPGPAGISSALRQLIENVRRVNGCMVLDWHERTLSNIGPWRGYFSRILALARYFSERDICEYVSLPEFYARWMSHVDSVFLGEKA